VILVAVTYCSAQLVLPSASWVLPTAKLITDSEADTEVKPVALSSPYLHPFGHHLATPYLQPLDAETEVKTVALSTPYLHPFGHHLTSPYLNLVEADSEAKPVALTTPYLHPFGHHLATPYLKPLEGESEVKTVALSTPYIHPLAHHLTTPYGFPLGHHLPYVVAAEEPAVAAEEETSRRRRDVSYPLPYLHAVPTVKKATIETKQFEDTDAATPADTKLIELTTKEHEINIPAVKYVQPVVNLKPVTYTAVSPAVLPYTRFPYHAAYHGFHYPVLAPAPVVETE